MLSAALLLQDVPWKVLFDVLSTILKDYTERGGTLSSPRYERYGVFVLPAPI